MGAMTYSVYYIGSKVGEGLFIAVGNEDWIIPKAVLSPRSFGNRSFAGSNADVQNRPLWIGNGNGGDKPSGSLSSFKAREIGQQSVNAVEIRSILARVSCRSDPRLTAKGIDLKTGIVCKR